MGSVPTLVKQIEGEKTILVGPLLGIENEDDKFLYNVCFLLKGRVDKTLKVNYAISEYLSGDLFESSAETYEEVKAHRIKATDIPDYDFPKQLRIINGYSFFRAEIKLDKKAFAQKLEYKIKDSSGAYQSVHNVSKWFVYIPPKDEHGRIAYASCNGWTSSFTPLKTYDLWERLLEHQSGDDPYSLILLGGDQIYSDSFTNRIISNHEKYDEYLVHEEYLDEYYRAFTYNYSVAQYLAQVPSIMMWDDHDICDGWGSYADQRGNQTLPGMQKLFKVAIKFFNMFQLRGGIGYNRNLLDSFDKFEITNEGSLKNHFSLKLNWTEQIKVLSMDLRSNRTPMTIMNDRNISDCHKEVGGTEYLYIMSSIPMAYVELGEWAPETGLDDLRDHWHHADHTNEFEAFIRRIDPSLQDTKVILLSGDVHHAGVSQLEVSLSGQIKPYLQLISSGIVHPANPAHSLLLELKTSVYDRGSIKVKLLKHGSWKKMKLSPNSRGNRRKSTWYKISRTFLSLSKEQDELNASWYTDSLLGFGKGPQTRMCSLKKYI